MLYSSAAPVVIGRSTGAHQTSFTHRHRAIPPGISKLMYAAQQGDVQNVRKIIHAKPAELFEKDRTGKSALHYCCTSDNICAAQAADFLVMAAPDLVESRDDDGFTPLHLAVIAGNMPLVTFLLANKADVNATDNEKHTVVHWATVCGETSALRAVLAAGAPVSTPDVHGGFPLHYAAQMCGGEKESNLGLEVLQALLAHPDIVVTVKDGDGREPLLWAASAGSSKAMLALIRAGTSVEASDKDGLTALHCAASRGHTDCLDSLLTLCGASPDVIDSNGCTALHYAVTLGHADATAILLAHGADPNRQDRKGRSPAHCGCAKGQFETVKMIGAHGANLWLRNARGDFPLHDAAASGRRDLVKWLLEMRPSQVNSRNNDGRCPLHLAALNDNSDMCKILIDAGAQVNPILRTSKNVFMTPLDCALQRGFRSTAKYLQLHGGIPANRLSDAKQGANSAALSLQIRDDVTFWGTTSSDSERENGRSEKRNNKKTIRRKMAYKYDKKKLMSTSDASDRDEKLPSASHKKPSSKITKRSVKSNNKSRLDYTNEIIINGKTEINIHQTREINVKTPQEEIASNTSPVLEEIIHKETTDKRPISAKEKISSAVIHKDQSTNTSEDTSNEIETVIEIKPTKIEKTDTLADQQSLLSNTSEDVEEAVKNLVVQASIHSPPKHTIKEENTTSKMQRSASKLQKQETIREEPTDHLVQTVSTIIESNDTIETTVTEHTASTKAELAEAALKESSPQELAEATPKESSPEQLLEATQKESSPEQLSEAELTKSALKESPPEQLAESAPKESPSEQFLEAASKESPPEQFLEAAPKEQFSEAASKESQSEPLAEATPPEQLGKTEPKQPSQETKLTAGGELALVDGAKKIDGLLKAAGETHAKIAETLSNVLTDKPQKTAQNLPDESAQKPHSPDSSSSSSSVHSSDSAESKTHKSFRVLDDDKDETEKLDGKPGRQIKQSSRKLRDSLEKQRSRSSEEIKRKVSKEKCKSKIPTPLTRNGLSKSDKHLDVNVRKVQPSSRIPSLPNIHHQAAAQQTKSPRCDSNLSAPLPTSVYSDNDISELEELKRTSSLRKKRVKRRSRNRDSRSAGSDYESSNLIDSGFEPSPRSSRIPKWRNMTERGVNMTSVTQSIQTNIRRYHLERKIFQHLLDLKRMQIRAGQHNEAILVKRAIDNYHQSCASTVGAGRYVPDDYSFKNFEKFLYHALRKLQKNGVHQTHLKGLPETPRNPLHCTQSTHRCMHATHAYTGIPCAAYLPKMDHHTIPKIGFNNNSTSCRPGTGPNFLPNIIRSKKAVTLELCHGNDKQIISLPADRLDQNKRYYVTFTIKGQEPSNREEENNSKTSSHQHSKSD